ASDDGAVIVDTTIGVRLRAGSQALPEGAPVKLMIRPERLTPGGGPANRFRSRVEALVYLGQSWKARLALGEAGRLIVRWTAEPDRHGRIEVGDEVEVGCAPEDVRIVGGASAC